MIAATVSRAVAASSLTPEEVATRAGMTRARLAHELEDGPPLDVAELVNVADALNVTPEVFFRADPHSSGRETWRMQSRT